MTNEAGFLSVAVHDDRGTAGPTDADAKNTSLSIACVAGLLCKSDCGNGHLCSAAWRSKVGRS